MITLGVGLAANASVFGVVDALMLRPFPLPDIDLLVQIWETVPARGEDRFGVSPANFLDWRRQNRSFEHVVATEWWDASLSYPFGTEVWAPLALDDKAAAERTPPAERCASIR